MAFSEPHSLMLDAIADGQWHTVPKIAKRTLHFFKKDRDAFDKAIQLSAKEGYLIAGHNSSYRFHPRKLMGWRDARGLIAPTKRDLRSPRLFGGVLEDEGWAQAPLRKHDMLHFRVKGELNAAKVQKRVGIQGLVRQDIDGLIRVSTLVGEELQASLQAWELPEHSSLSGVRLDKNVKRRELADLPVGFMDDLCSFYGTFAHTLIRNSMSSVRKHIQESDDVQQQIYMWIIDAVQRYDESTSIPFAAYLHASLQRWVHDLNRKSFGRAVADDELKISRAITAFTTKYDRKPTDKELADEMGVTLLALKAKRTSVNRVANIRTTAPLVQEDYEIPLKAEDSQEDDYQNLVEQTLLSAALTSSANNGQPKRIQQWLAMYDIAYKDGKNLILKNVDSTELMTEVKERLKASAVIR